MKTQLIAFIISSLLMSPIWAQPINTEIIPEGKSPVLLGKINKEGLSGENYVTWFTENYEEYSPKTEIINQLKNEINGYTITAFMGTWCGDSKREVPKFYKILEETQFPLERLTLIAVSGNRESYKQSPGGEEEGLNIHRVPTFIFYKDGKEVNRIVEHPVGALEDDILAIYRNNYTSNYHAVTIVHEALAEMGIKKFSKKSKKLLPKLKVTVKNKYELNTYSSVLFYADKKDKAIAVAHLNTLLFPEEAYVYTNLAKKLYQTGEKMKALENYEKALSLDPENKKAKSGIAMLIGEKTD